jgi:hypothetical protein
MLKKLALALGLGAFLLSGTTLVYAAADPAASCKNAKLKGTGKKAFDLLKALGKNIKKPDDAKLAGGVSKAQSKFTKSFTKAENKGGCETTADSDAIEMKTDEFVADVIAELDGGSPSGAFLDSATGLLD